MAEPEHAGDDEAQHHAEQPSAIGLREISPARRLIEMGCLRQIIGEQRHGDAEYGVGKRLQAPHFETIGRRVCHGEKVVWR